MGFRYRPGFNIGKNVHVGKRGVSVRTGIPGLTFRSDFKKRKGQLTTEPAQPLSLIQKIIWALALGFMWFLLYMVFFHRGHH